MLLDVVYNHFGPEGNYLHAYAPQFFTDRHQTPWGAAINFDGAAQRAACATSSSTTRSTGSRSFSFDGLRFDAVHAIVDDSTAARPDRACARRARGPGGDAPVHLVLENDANQAQLPRRARPARDTFDAQWNDDVHHCLHTILTGETDGYYADYADGPHALLCRSLAEGLCLSGRAFAA